MYTINTNPDLNITSQTQIFLLVSPPPFLSFFSLLSFFLFFFFLPLSWCLAFLNSLSKFLHFSHLRWNLSWCFVLGVRIGQLLGTQLKDLIYAFDDKEKEPKGRRAFVRLVYQLVNSSELQFYPSAIIWVSS